MVLNKWLKLIDQIEKKKKLLGNLIRHNVNLILTMLLLLAKKEMT
jgi:hypothetical protein